MRKHLAMMALLLAGLPAAGGAQETGAAVSSVLQSGDLPRSLSFVLRSPPASSVQRLAATMLKVDPSGVLTPDSLLRYESMLLARERAGVMQELLAMDLDFDGKVTAEERRAVLDRMDSREKVAAVLALSGADQDGDGAVTLEEMRLSAKTTQHIGRRGQNEMEIARDLMLLDGDGDGVLTLAEMKRSVYSMLAQ